MVVKKLKVIDDKELKKLKTESKSCIVINDLIYDVSSFYEHPGGYDLFKEYEGLDATDAFNSIGHSENAKNLMNSFLIGIKKNSKEYKKKEKTKIIENKIEYINYSDEEIKKEEKEPQESKPKENKPTLIKKEDKTNYPVVAGIIILFGVAYYFLFLK
ncbi:hypothetical protein PFAG_03985 [Plasmodium falciparum Santa Lucia]|uniref:Cytochrome b5, putative n=11 Tax=Plasmodium falciparum TaxID=5833 RepID=Q8I599_PLAF7|nr:cytochrome b5, putative [Plasmodium falciparum 3D7]ETW35308.1 hypothetical protein PFTANZ_03959 [Plasmodium falciparum Tanzania (2000708)]ETW41495.1 hypothetical protein PFNF135_04142 [Plasmodium falciparum NF135/5.C10]ETW48174.1 hypothetical protein PFMALIP_03879 [Plasmodium falciparum MaliPS096_E11]ETW56014.1 hypothetical protein PFUGPA_02058 [Plasmodium falciparum Palo Alto/Uganda]ETW60135.1 hypothetical protein PFMC_03907 [Plasmodium falciparum CAMP/Malaysia]EUR68064.1 hypothetical pro|eukprot:XP_001350717.1 cytochrome b5, putative [Plasmodium falciparum 3D7]